MNDPADFLKCKHRPLKGYKLCSECLKGFVTAFEGRQTSARLADWIRKTKQLLIK